MLELISFLTCYDPWQNYPSSFFKISINQHLTTSNNLETYTHNEKENKIGSKPPEFGQEFDFPVNSALNLAKIAFRAPLMVHKKIENFRPNNISLFFLIFWVPPRPFQVP